MRKKLAVIGLALVLVLSMFAVEATPLFVDDAEAGRCSCKVRGVYD